MAIRDQGWSGAAMLPYSELEYSGFRDHLEGLMKRFSLQDGHKVMKGETVEAAKG